MDLRRDALQIFSAALEAADAGEAIRRHVMRTESRLRAGAVTLELESFERVALAAVGKAAVPMARALHHILGDRIADALVVTKHGHYQSQKLAFKYIEAGHPVPDQAGQKAAEMVRDLAARCSKRDLLIAGISGGASALLPAPSPPLTLEDKQQTTSLLLKAGADIGELNAVRKHLSFLKGGKLAEVAFPATVVSLLLSDVIGDRLDVIGSGLTAPDPSTFADALSVIDRYQLREALPGAVREHLLGGTQGLMPETPKPGDLIFQRVHNVIIASNRLALEAAAQKASDLGYRTHILSSEIEGETKTVATDFVTKRDEERRPMCLLAGGETTVKVSGEGKGGRNQEFALASALALNGVKDVLVLSAGTDGTDGPTDAAGAIATGDSAARAAALGIDAKKHLDANDSYQFFERLGDLIRTGPTGTNVMDIHILLAK